MKRKYSIRILTCIMAAIMLFSTLLSILTVDSYAADEEVDWRLSPETPLISFFDAMGNPLPGLEKIPADLATLSIDSSYVSIAGQEKLNYDSMDIYYTFSDYDYYVYEDNSNLPDTERMIAELEFQNQCFSAADIRCGRISKGYLKVDILFEKVNFFDDVHNEVNIFLQYWRKNEDGDDVKTPSKGSKTYVFTQAASLVEDEEDDKLNIELVLPQEEEDIPLDIVTPYILIEECTLGDGWKAVSAGSSFSVDLLCRNSHKSADLDNILLQVDVPEGLKLEHPSNTFYVGNIGNKERFQQSLNFSTSLSANVKNYSVGLSFTYEYVDEEKRKEDKTTATIQIPVYQQARFAVAPVDLLPAYAVEEQHEIFSAFANQTRGNIYNVTATLVTDAACPQKVLYLGNLSAGEGGAAKFELSSAAEGFENGEICYTYETEQGEKREEKVSFMMKFVIPEEETPTKEVVTEYVTDITAIDHGGLPMPWYIAAALLLVAGWVFIWVAKKNNQE